MKHGYGRPRSPGRILGRYAAANFLILLLPTALALVYYQVSASAIMRSVDELVMGHLDSGLAALDRAFSELRRSAARFASDYEINLYLNKTGPLTGIETYNLKRISDKVAPLVHGSDLVSNCYIHFARSGMVAYESGFSSYADFYGPLLAVEGFDPGRWRDLVLSAAKGESLLPGLRVTFGGRSFAATAAIWPLGYGDYVRGAVVGILDERALILPLERLASAYGGRVALLDRDGRLVSVAGPGAAGDDLLVASARGGPTVETIHRATGRYRVYRSSSSLAGWAYAAALDEASVLAGARKVRDRALLLLALALVAGSLAAFGLATTQARPLRRLLALVLGPEIRGAERGGSVYQRAEEAIMALSDSRDRLRAEALEAEETARGYFFRRLLEGAYRERELFEAEAARFRIDLSGPGRYVLLCRMTAPEALPVGPPPAGGRDMRLDPSGLGPGEYLVATALGESAFILRAEGDRRAAVKRIVEALRALSPLEARAGLSFAAGEPVADPLLLQASILQARAALGRRSSGAHEAVFYADLPESAGGPRFAIDLEESIMKAVRSSNALLLASLLDSLVRANFEERDLSPAEAQDLAAGLRMTALRLLPEFPAEAASIGERLYARAVAPDPRAAIEGAAAALAEMAELAGRRKRSHNSELARQARAFIERNYASPGLGLGMVAESHRLSENYLSNLYKEQEGECVSETIEKVRIGAARRLLAGSAESIDAIAAACGYRSGVSFRRAFKRVAGVSPSDYRRARSEEDA